MYDCPNCGGTLRFDIPSQQLKCDYCSSLFDPYQYKETDQPAESAYYNTTIYTCPQCGGEIQATNITASGFCTFCGSATVLNDHLKAEKRPKYIIPFRLTKEDCKQTYKREMRQFPFAPSELKDPEYLERFRGFYIPYWLYRIRVNGDIHIPGNVTHRTGNYINTDHYDLTCRLDADYDSAFYDASSSFDDHISENIAPFDIHTLQPFAPSMLCGFYADTADVDDTLYLNDAKDLILGDVCSKVQATPEFLSFHPAVSEGTLLSGDSARVQCKKPDCAMFPVWFLTYRKHDRVSYAVLNGQTGKLAADYPISVGKYLLASLILAVPLFFLANLMFTMKANTALGLSTLLSMFAEIIFLFELRSIRRRELHLDDKGYRAQAEENNIAAIKKRPVKKKKEKLSPGKIGFYFVFFFVLILILLPGGSGMRFASGAGPTALAFIMLIVTLILFVLIRMTSKDLPGVKTTLPALSSLLAVIVACIICAAHPVSDWVYYAGVILALAGILITLVGIINRYNLLASRPLPSFFNRKGGDDRA